MAAVIHTLWEKGDRNPLILPGNIPIEDHRVQFELTRYLSDNWVPVIEKDVDGPYALPLKLDGEIPNLGKYHACRRVARTVYLGSAPTATAANRGIEERGIRLGCVFPGENAAIFADALRRLASAATYLYQDGTRYWYSTQPTVTKIADDRAEQYRRDPDKVSKELDRRLRTDLRNPGDFSRVHPVPQSGQDVPDEMDVRLVVLGVDHPHSREAGSRAEVAAKAILESRGNTPRLFWNTLVFLAVDQARLQDLDEAVRRFLAWESILAERDTLDLSPHQVKQAENQKESADGVVKAWIPEAYQWLLVPEQKSPQSAVEWQAFRLAGQGPLADRASKKLRNDDLLFVVFAGTRLRLDLDKIPLWRGDHVAIKQLAEDFARYLYLPRLRDSNVLYRAIRDGLGLLTWNRDSFAYADSFDEASGRYRGLRCGQIVNVSDSNSGGLVVRAEPALKQYEADTRVPEGGGGVPKGASVPGTQTPETSVSGASPTTPNAGRKKQTRFHGSVSLDPTRVGRDAARVADEVIAHLVGLVGSDVKVTIEVDADIPSGAPDHVVRTVTENSQTLKFATFSFESE